MSRTRTRVREPGGVRRLIIPKFYSFLDNTYGTLKVGPAVDVKSVEGYIGGDNPTQGARVVLVHRHD